MKADADIEVENAGWSFKDIADDFTGHVRRSVPLYDVGHDLVCQIGDFFLPHNASVTELGVSTGELAGRFLKHNERRTDLSYTGIDVEEGMIAKAREHLGDDDRAKLLCEDITTAELGRNSMIISYYTMQFIHPHARQQVFDRVYESLQWGGAFLLFEKVRAPDARFQDIASQVYQEFKLQQQFSEEEILSKQRSLKGVLEPFSTQGNIDLLKRAGFVDITSVMKWVCFEGFLAIK